MTHPARGEAPERIPEYFAKPGITEALAKSHPVLLVRQMANEILSLRSATPAMEKLLRDLLDRAYKMMEMAGYKVVEQNPDHNNPIISWMADARTMLYGSGHKPDMARDLRTKT